MTTLVIPAAGNGSRLGLPGTPKALAPFGTGTLLSTILNRVGHLVDDVVIVTKPGLSDTFRNSLTTLVTQIPENRFRYVTQEHPIGSLDAVSAGLEYASGAAIVLWCDQIGVSSSTVETMINHGRSNDFVMPYLKMRSPYVWLELEAGKITRVGRSRDGDTVPDVGYADLGVFGLSLTAMRKLKEIAPELAQELGEREIDFTYALPALARSLQSSIFETHDALQALAVNTAEDLRNAEQEILRERN